jgi:DNA adenine methylase
MGSTGSAKTRTYRYRVPRPFVKWVGGKSQIREELKSSVIAFQGRYHEPFIGGGALYFELLPEKASLSDTNRELINCYLTIRDHAEALIKALKPHIYEKDYYYEVRAVDPKTLDPIGRAARTIYLNKAGFNGLYRVNSKGLFNVPFGRYKNPTLCDEPNLRSCASALKKATIECRPFEQVLEKTAPGDFVYFDPPYVPVSETADFTSYQKSGFNEGDQIRLRQVFDALKDRGVHAMLSNSDVPFIHTQYKHHSIRVIQANRLVNSNPRRRGPVGEVIVTNY